MKKNTLIIMANYCSTGLILEGKQIHTIDKRLPYYTRYLSNRIDNWQREYEDLVDKNFKYIQQTKRFRKWQEEGFKIAKKIKRLSKGRLNVIYFSFIIN